jgi:SAM-dependent methyltransferase
MTEQAHPEWDASYTADTPAPWDIGRPQPTFVRLADEGRLTGRLLDAGCGTGENALLAASRGADVTGIDGVQHARDREGGIVQRHEHSIIQGVQADRDTAQARGREQPGLAGEQRPVRRQGDVPNAVDPGQHRDQPLQVAAQQRLAAGQAQLAHPEAREHPPESRQLLEGEQILAGQEREVTAEYLAGHAVGAAELAAVSDRDPQVPQRPPEGVSRRQVPSGHHSTPARKIPTMGTVRPQPGRSRPGRPSAGQPAPPLADGCAAAGKLGLQPGDLRAQVIDVAAAVPRGPRH